MSRDVIIIGGGASGMMAALAAAENGCRVTLLERQSRVGRKLLATGNGRCNLTNHNVSPARYHGGGGFCAYALDAFDVGATLQFFASLGLLTVTEDSGRVYPLSNMAGSVLDVLRYALERPGIEILVAVGDTVAKDQGLVTLESDKATLEVPSSAAGVVTALRVKIGDSLSSI